MIGDTYRSMGLVRAFRQYWWETSHTFHFRGGEATITPYDFAVITGLRFTERPIFTAEIEPLGEEDILRLDRVYSSEEEGEWL